MEHMEWRSYHLYYHGTLSRAVTDFVQPVVASLFAQGRVDRFFFVRYALGGPHIRLRLRVHPRDSGAVGETLADAAKTFFERWPAEVLMREEVIQRINRTILATDPSEVDDAVYPNHSIREFPFRPETERYGGPELLGHSLDFFTISSVEALRFLDTSGTDSRGRQLMAIFRILARQALGFATDEEELFSLLEYPMEPWGRSLRGVVEQGDRSFMRQRKTLRSLFQQEMETFLTKPLSAPFEPTRRFSWEIRTTDLTTRRSIETSHLHMTANRLGLTNPEEVYLSRLLSRTARELAESNPTLWISMRRSFAERLKSPVGADRLRDLVRPLFVESFSSSQRVPSEPAPAPIQNTEPREYDWVHFVARHDAAGKRWVNDYRRLCSTLFQVIRQSLVLLRRRQITAGREALAQAETGMYTLEVPCAFAHVMDRWYFGALAYFLYCTADFKGAQHALERARQAIVAAIEKEPLLLPLAQTCHEFPLHEARIAYHQGRWRDARRNIEHARRMLLDLEPLCVLSEDNPVFFSQLAEYYREIPGLDAEESAFLGKILDQETRLHHFERVAAGIYVTPVIPYP